MTIRTLGDCRERELVAMLRELLPASQGSNPVGPGDDAAVLSRDGAGSVWSVDRQRQGTHFEPSWLGYDEIGRRAVTIAASDIWAMGAQPRWALCALELPRSMAVAEFAALIAGLGAGASTAGAEIVGGDIGVGESLGVVTTVGGVLLGDRPLLRSGASPGDEVWLVGEVGLAAAGRAFLSTRSVEDTDMRHQCVAAFRNPKTPQAFCRWAATSSAGHALMDISDGVALDVARMAAASGVGVELDATALAAAVPAEVAAALGRQSLDLVLGGGDDYAMLCAVAPEAGPEVQAAAGPSTCRRVGIFTPPATGMVVNGPTGSVPLGGSGWDPFRGECE